MAGRQAKNGEPNLVPFLLELFCHRKGEEDAGNANGIKSRPYRENKTYIFNRIFNREKAGKEILQTQSSVWFRKAKKYLKNKLMIEELGVLFRGLGNSS